MLETIGLVGLAIRLVESGVPLLIGVEQARLAQVAGSASASGVLISAAVVMLQIAPAIALAGELYDSAMRGFTHTIVLAVVSIVALVLLGNLALDDPEASIVLETIRKSADDHIIVLTVDDATLVNALQRKATVVLQKSTREGFGLTVTEAMWKGAAVVGGNVGGIRRQITNGESGFLVDSVDQAAQRIVQIIKNPDLRERLGTRAKETVRQNFLMSRLVEDWIDFLSNFGSDTEATASSLITRSAST